jgi:hypothetical protein
MVGSPLKGNVPQGLASIFIIAQTKQIARERNSIWFNRRLSFWSGEKILFLEHFVELDRY